METRNVNVTLEKAKEWYKKGGDLKEVALQAFTEEELKCPDFRNIVTFEDACTALGIPTSYISPLTNVINILQGHMESYSKASIAMLKLNIIRQALNQGQKMELTKGNIWYPYTPFVTKKSTYYNDELRNGSMEKVAKFKVDGEEYILLGGCAYTGSAAGLGYFNSSNGVAYSDPDVGFLGCASREIAEHMSRYFAKEIFEAKYGDLVSYKWV